MGALGVPIAGLLSGAEDAAEEAGETAGAGMAGAMTTGAGVDGMGLLGIEPVVAQPARRLMLSAAQI